MKAVMISIRPEWCEKIANGRKTLEIRKTKPKLETPFKCYIYCTYGLGLIEYHDGDCPNMLLSQKVDSKHIWGNCCNGKVIGEFACDNIRCIDAYDFVVREDAEKALKGSGLEWQEAKQYAGWQPGPSRADYKPLYGWHISNLVIYDTPKELGEFLIEGNQTFDYPPLAKMKRPPQSWCYVEENTDEV